jgi:hypothetical protein
MVTFLTVRAAAHAMLLYQCAVMAVAAWDLCRLGRYSLNLSFDLNTQLIIRPRSETWVHCAGNEPGPVHCLTWQARAIPKTP